MKIVEGGDYVVDAQGAVIPQEIIQRYTEYLKEYFDQFHNTQAVKNNFLNIYGPGGSGKTTIVRYLESMESEYKNNLEHIYVDLSDCNREVDVLYKVAKFLDDNYPADFSFAKFILIYNHYYGKKAAYIENATGKEAKEKIAEKGKDFFMDIAKPDEVFKKLLGSNILSEIPLLSLVEFAYESGKEYASYRKLKDALDELNSYANTDWGRREALHKLFLNTIKNASMEMGDRSIAIFLDNYVYCGQGELARGDEWLVDITKNIPFLWVVSGRSVIECDNCSHILIRGLSHDEVIAYLSENADPQAELSQDIFETAWLKLREKYANQMDGYLQGENNGKNDAEYVLPISMVNIKNYIQKEGKQITVEALMKYQPEENSSYYFTADMSEALLNAVQIMSCLPTWNHEWISFLSQKYNNHMLNAWYLLSHNSSIEVSNNMNDESMEFIKLHEEVRQALYNSTSNYIKRDIQKYMYKQYVSMYDKEQKKRKFFMDTDIVHDMKLVNNFVRLSIDYLQFLSSTDQGICSRMLEPFERNLHFIYNANKAAEIVTSGFIAIYADAIERLNLIKINLDGGCPSRATIRANILKRLELADLHTNIYQTMEALNIEKDTLPLAKELWQSVPANDIYGRSNEQILYMKTLNAYLFDCSAAWQYDLAYEEGIKALELISDLLNYKDESTLLGYIYRHNPDKSGMLAAAIEGLYYVFQEGTELFDGSEFGIEGDITISRMKDIFNTLFKPDCINILGDIRLPDSTKSIADGLLLIKRAILNEICNIRGNFPWYLLKSEKGKNSKIKPIQFGINTYLIRKSLVDCDWVTEKKDNWYLQSYHNIACYRFKKYCAETTSGENSTEEDAQYIKSTYDYGKKAYERRRMSLSSQTVLTYAADQRRKKVVNELKELKWRALLLETDQFKDAEAFVQEILREHKDTIESLQYLGDYALHCNEKDNEALLYFFKATIYRYIYLGIFQSSTCSSICRLAITLYILGEQGSGCELLNSMLEKIKTADKIFPKDRIDMYFLLEKKMNDGSGKVELLKVID